MTGKRERCGRSTICARFSARTGPADRGTAERESDFGFFECTYIVDGEIITSTLYLLAEFGLPGVLIDPLIVQVPDGVVEFSGTYDDGSGPHPLEIWGTNAFQVEPGEWVYPEAGQELFVLDIPPSVSAGLPGGDPTQGQEFDFTFTFTHHSPLGDPVEPVIVKAMFTGHVEVNGHDYFVPILPCVRDFASIPGMEIPVSEAPVELIVSVGDMIRGGLVSPC
ncbi:MAG TPA: hypothetical protein VJ768_08860, partial [Anaerolineales bacterium]|nr:hypothetical protein [Anaerolineales bacterium]